AEAPLIGPCASGHAEWKKKERIVVSSESEIVFALAAARGEMRQRHKVWPVRGPGSRIGLLHSGVNREGWSAGEGRNVQELPSGGENLADRLKEADAVKRQGLKHADGKYVADVEGRGTFFRALIERILR